MSTSVPKYKAKRERKLKKLKKTITPSSGQQPPISILERERIEVAREKRRPFHQTEGYLEFSDLKHPLISW